MAEKLCELQKKGGSGGGLPSSLINVDFQFRPYGNTDKTQIINTSNVNSMKVWSYNTAQTYGGTVKSPLDTTLANVANTLSKSNAITIDVSAFDYVYVLASTTGTFSLAYAFLS